MAKNDNLTDFLTDVADAIREKKGTSESINPQDFSSEIASIETGGGNGWTGHADADGLRAIGWTEEDIAYYQENGVDWDEEDDHLHLVSDDNKALYGVLTPYNISSYRDRIVYLPKIDFSGIAAMNNRFYQCHYLIAIPQIDTSSATNTEAMFMYCYRLRSVPPLDLRNTTTARYIFYQCFNIEKVDIKISDKCTIFREAFYQCVRLKDVSSADIDLSSVESLYNTYGWCVSLGDIMLRNTGNVTEWTYALNICTNSKKINGIDLSSATNITNIIATNFNLIELEIVNLNQSINIPSYLLSKQSLIGIINNAYASVAITITLPPTIYNKYANDPDVVEALTNHPNITLAK